MSARATFADYRFEASERPLFPGSPYSPVHHPLRRVAYVAVALLVGIAATLGNALVTVNLASVAGTMGITVSDATWLSSIYVAVNASANLLLVRARVQFGIPRVTHFLLVAYALTTIIQLAQPSFATALLVRAASGAAGTALTTVVIYNLLQVFPLKVRPLAILLGISITTFGVPLARLFPIALLTVGEWQGLHLVELALTFGAIAALWAVPLPPSDRSPAFERLDFVTVALVLPGMLLFCGALGAGRFLWWTDTEWLGWALAGATALFGMAILIERNRARPLLLIGWIGSVDILRFAAVALLVRFALAEQMYGAIGLLSAGGLGNDQLHPLFLIVSLAMLLGTVVAALTLGMKSPPWQVLVAALAISLGAWLDSGATNLTRPAQLYVSQALLGFGACLFIGPALLYGFVRVLQLGPNYLVSYLVVFGISQNVGGLLGSAALGTYQVARTREHAAALSEHLVSSDPQVSARLAQQGAGGLYAALQREAAVLAFNDVFQLVAMLALATASFIFIMILWVRFRERRQAAQEASA